MRAPVGAGDGTRCDQSRRFRGRRLVRPQRRCRSVRRVLCGLHCPVTFKARCAFRPSSARGRTRRGASSEQSWNVLWNHHKNAASPLRSAIPRPGAAVSWQKRLPMRAYDPAWLFHRRCSRRRQDRRQRRSEKGRAPSMRWFDSLASIRPNDVWYNPGTLLEMGDRSGGENQCTR